MFCYHEMSPEENLKLDISITEVESAVKQLRNGKSHGLDGTSNELHKKSSVFIVPLLCWLYPFIRRKAV